MFLLHSSPWKRQVPIPHAPPILITEQDENTRESAHSIREAASLFSNYYKCLRLIE